MCLTADHGGEAHVRGRDAEERRPRVFPSLPLSSLSFEEIVLVIAKTQKSMVICFDYNVFDLELFIELIYFFQFHPSILGFYIRFGPHSLNCNVFGLESFIE
jgi:hypothetical protein